jgi:isopenicillin N synthase-like dioxygenase
MGTSRYSVPFFMHPVSDMPLNCLENCVDAENQNSLRTTAGDYLYERLVDLGLIKSNL